jgi:hypothetical protein
MALLSLPLVSGATGNLISLTADEASPQNAAVQDTIAEVVFLEIVTSSGNPDYSFSGIQTPNGLQIFDRRGLSVATVDWDENTGTYLANVAAGYQGKSLTARLGVTRRNASQFQAGSAGAVALAAYVAAEVAYAKAAK